MSMHPARSVRLAPAIVLGGLVLLGVPAAREVGAAPIKVACIGEQTTHSDLFPGDPQSQPPGMQEYPRKLQDLLGAGYVVNNFGDCCASVIGGYVHSETHPYVSGKNYKAAVAFAPDIVVIGSWGRHDWGKSAMTALASFTIPAFQTGYEDIITKFQALPSKPKIFASTLIPIPNGMDGPDDGYKTSPASNVVTMLAAKYSLPIVDLFTAFTGATTLFIQPPMKDSDGEHTSDAGGTKIAQLVAAAILGMGAPAPAADGGVPLPGADAGSTTGSGGKGAGSGAGGAPVVGGGSGGDTGSGGSPGSLGASGGATVIIPVGTGGSSAVTSSSGGATVSFSSGGATGSFGSSTGGAVASTGSSGTGAQPGATTTTDSGGSSSGCSVAPGHPGSRTGLGLGAALVGLVLVLRRRGK
jgi:MYXO-CTERM domain-containing protein